MARTICQERSHLLRMIHEASSSVHRLSSEVFRLSREPQTSRPDRHLNFAELNQLHQLGILRVKTLRECLDLHIDLHHCE